MAWEELGQFAAVERHKDRTRECEFNDPFFNHVHLVVSSGALFDGSVASEPFHGAVAERRQQFRRNVLVSQIVFRSQVDTTDKLAKPAGLKTTLMSAECH